VSVNIRLFLAKIASSLDGQWTQLGLPVVEVMGDQGTQEATTFLGMGIWIAVMAPGLALSVLIGVSLGFFGGGGSILTSAKATSGSCSGKMWR
jgi:hypothetical protein